ncbi:MAG: FKBP-type peptidyl-prolyl cis-trans isomerase [Methanoregula sp.]|nr:MAG: FKBP-type peptidyl-prolyl cis-trans isomerase [Methanoregula sp.]
MKKSEKLKGKDKTEAKKQTYIRYGIAAAACCAVLAIVLFLVLSPTGAKTGDSVSVLYIGTLENGTVFDSNLNKTPLTFTLGAHTVIPGFEDAVIGMNKGEVKTVHIPVDRAYGQYQSELLSTVSRSLFPADAPPVTGMYYSVRNPTDSSVNVVKVVNVMQDSVTIDQNHMLAGQNLTFMIRLIGINLVK